MFAAQGLLSFFHFILILRPYFFPAQAFVLTFLCGAGGSKIKRIKILPPSSLYGNEISTQHTDYNIYII